MNERTSSTAFRPSRVLKTRCRTAATARCRGGRYAEVHPAVLALPLAVDHLVGELAGDGGAEADRLPRAARPSSCADGRRPRRPAACRRRRAASARRSSGAAPGTTSRASGTGRRARRRRGRGRAARGSQSRRTSAEEPIRNVRCSVEIPRRSHSARMRSASSCDGVTASWSAPLAAKTIVLAPAPVSSVAIPGCTVRSMNASASHASPQNSDWPCRPGGAARSSSVSDMRGSYRLAPMAARARADHRDRRPGRLAARGAAARTRGTRCSGSSGARPRSSSRTWPRSATGSSSSRPTCSTSSRSSTR